MNNTSDITENAFPLLGENQHGLQFILDLSDKTPLSHELIHNQPKLQKYIEQTYYKDYKWGVSKYLEYRSYLLKPYDQMTGEKRFYHLGLDIIAKVHTSLHAPRNGIVFYSGVEDGAGNYGGMVILRHEKDNNDCVYSLYGHLDISKLPNVGDKIKRGEVFARMGDMECNGCWFIHTHVQLLTQKAIDEGWIFRGYCTENQIDFIDEYCPSPMKFINIRQSSGHKA